MKRLLALLLILCLVLGGCSTADKTDGKKEENKEQSVTQQEQYNAAPAASDDISVFVEGKQLTHIYKGETTYINFTEVLNILGGEITSQGQAEPFITDFTVRGKSFTISNDSIELAEGDTLHPLVHYPLYDGTDWYLPMVETMSLLGLQNFTDTESKNSYYTYIPYNDVVEDGKQIPVLMYHAVGEQPWSSNTDLFVRPVELEKQLSYLKENGFTTITFEDFDHLGNIEKPVMLTFDDGYDDNYTELLPLLEKYNAKATVFVITSLIGNEHYLTEQQIKAMSDSGRISIQSHTVSHSFLSDLSEDELEEEMTQSKATLTKITGKEPFVLCYPTGKYSNLSLTKTRDHYQYGLLMNGGMYTTGQNGPYMIPRFYISRATDINSFADKIN